MAGSKHSFKLGGCLFEASPCKAPQLVLGGAPAGLPAKVDLRPKCTPVEHQLQVNSCAANAVVGALEYLRAKAGQPMHELSRLYVYYNARKIADRQTLDEGTYIHHAMAAVLAFGVCEERMWPYQEALKNQEPTQACYSNATRYEAVMYARAALPDVVLQVLASELPVVFGAYFPSRYYDEAWETKAMPLPGKKPEEAGSGHAMLVVGYDLASRHFIVRNSWGTPFADQGYCYIPFETMMTYAHPEHFWSIGQMADHRGMTTNGYPVADFLKGTLGGANAEARAPQTMEQALSVLRQNSALRDKLMDGIDATKKGIRDRLRGPGAGGGY